MKYTLYGSGQIVLTCNTKNVIRYQIVKKVYKAQQHSDSSWIDKLFHQHREGYVTIYT